MQAKIKINMKVLRAAVFILFLLSVAVTAWSLLSPGDSAAHDTMTHGEMAHGDMTRSGISLSHALHITHVVMITLTFLLIALYLYKSAEIASLMAYRELKLRLTVDPDVGFIERLPTGAPVFNACAGALARKGIYTGSPGALQRLAVLDTIAIADDLESREGYDVTVSTLDDMGASLSDDVSSCPVKLLLGPFDPQTGPKFDFVLTHDKITHVLAAVYISRLFVKFSRFLWSFLILVLLAAAALTVFGYYTYAAAAIAVWAASLVLSVYRIEKKTARLSFASVSKC